VTRRSSGTLGDDMRDHPRGYSGLRELASATRVLSIRAGRLPYGRRCKISFALVPALEHNRTTLRCSVLLRLRRLGARCWSWVAGNALDDREDETVRSRRAAVYLGCASVLAACAALGYDALFPFLPAAEGVLTWSSPSPPSGPLLSLRSPGKERAAVGQATAALNWPPDPSSSAMPYYSDTIRLLLPQPQASDDDGAEAEEAAQGSTADAAQLAVAQKLADAPRADSAETIGQAAPPRAETATKDADSEARTPESSERRRYRQYYYYYYQRHHHRHWRHHRG
jgi:hypothetical protein